MCCRILHHNPKSILDVGVGYGKWGLLCRELLESWQKRIYPGRWEVWIDGVEICREYIKKFPWLLEFYDMIYIEDISSPECMPLQFDYDLCICGDVLEHIEKPSAIETIKRLQKKCKAILVSLPCGEGWLDNVIAGDNPYEKHKSVWDGTEMSALGFRLVSAKPHGRGPIRIFEWILDKNIK